MNKRKDYAGVDYFRIIAAFMIVAIHTAPLEGINGTADFLLTYCLGRIGVPFFLGTTGFFLLTPFARHGGRQFHNNMRKREQIPAWGKVKRYLLRTLVMYGGVTLLYLPITIYADNLPGKLTDWLKWLFLDGTFYHLWYLPAALLGCFITVLLLRYTGQLVTGCCLFLFYLIGLLGDSYYGAISGIPALESVYSALFSISEYTRNGVFYAPIFLWIGAMIGARRSGGLRSGKREIRFAWIGFAISLVLMLAEGYLSWRMEWQRHNSMYLFLLPAIFFFMKGLLMIRGRSKAFLRPVSMWIFLLHPLCIVVLRGGAEAVGLRRILVENQLVFFLLVCAASLCAGSVLEFLFGKVRKWKHERQLVNMGKWGEIETDTNGSIMDELEVSEPQIRELKVIDISKRKINNKQE